MGRADVGARLGTHGRRYSVLDDHPPGARCIGRERVGVSAAPKITDDFQLKSVGHEPWNLPSKTIVDVMTYLLPGFITAALPYALTPAPRPIPFERVVQALIFTIIIQVGVSAKKYGLLWAGRRPTPWGPWTDGIALGWSVGFAFALGLFLVWAANSDRIHSVRRKLRITHQTSYASEWYGAFCRHQGYVVLHLTGNRRLLGWAEEWPSTPDVGHFMLASAQWLLEENGETADRRPGQTLQFERV
jgi:hypothetical protein